MAAGVVATFIIFNMTQGWPDQGSFRDLLVLILTFGLASLMISTIKFPSFKELNWRSRASFGFLMIGVLSMILIAVKPEVTLFLILSGYQQRVVKCVLLKGQVGIGLLTTTQRVVNGP